MVAMGETRRDGIVKKEKKKKVEKATEAAKEPQPVVLKLRLFVGGLGPTVGAADLQQRFAPLGTVHRIDLVEGRRGWDPADAAQRGFAYVDFEAASEASLRKLFSAYNGCKWKGGVLRVEKAKEHYTDRLRREWAEAEVEAATKAKIAAKATAMATTQSRDMYSFTPDYEVGSGSPENYKVDLEQDDADEIVVDADAMAVDADLVAAQIEKERRGHLDLLSKLFPEDKDAEDEEEKIVEIVKLRAFPLPDANAKKRKHALENASEIASSSAPPNEDDSGVAGALDTNEKQKTKTRRVKFSEKAMDDEKVETKKRSKPILKKTQEDSKKMDVDEEEEEEEEEEYYLSSRSPSPEGGLSDESKWQRLFKYAGLEKGPEVAKPSTGLYTGINLDDDDDEEPVVETPPQNDGMFSGVLTEEEDEEPRQSTLGSKATDSVISKKTKMKKKTPVKTDGVGSDGIFSGILSDPEEEEDQPQVQESVPATEEPEAEEDQPQVQDSVAAIEEHGLSSDQGKESSDFEDANEDLQDIELSEEEDEEEEDEEEDEEDEDDGDDFVDAASALKSLTPTPLNDAARASKWARMFKTASTAAETVDGAFSGSLDEVDVPVRARPAVKEQRMFESAAADHPSEAPTASDKLVASDEEAIRQSSKEEDASTSSEDDVARTENKDGATDQEATGTAGGNLLARFDMEQDEANPTSVEQTSNPTSQPNAVDENTKWMQRASWKSLMGAEGRAAFSLKQVTGESEAPKTTTDAKKEASATFGFNFARNPPEATTSRLTTKRTEQMPKSSEKAVKPAKVADDEAGCLFMKSADADKDWRASKNELRIDSKAKHKAAVRKMKKMKGSGGAR